MNCVTPGCKKAIEIMDVFRCKECGEAFNKEWDQIGESFIKPRLVDFKENEKSVFKTLALVTSLYQDGSFLTLKVLFERIYLDLIMRGQRIAFLERKLQEAHQGLEMIKQVKAVEAAKKKAAEDAKKPAKIEDATMDNVVDFPENEKEETVH